MPDPMDGPGVRIRAEAGGFVLEARVDPATHRVLAMAGSGMPQEMRSALCRESLGHTVQDVSEHAVIRVESVLRGAGPRPVPGVVQPENAGLGFRETLALVRGLLEDYVAKTGYKIATNTEEGSAHQASSEWGTSTVSERMQRIGRALFDFRLEGFVESLPVQVKEISGPRVTLYISKGIPADVQRRYMTKAEEFLRKEVDPKLELFLTDRKDANTKRHALPEALGLSP